MEAGGSTELDDAIFPQPPQQDQEETVISTVQPDVQSSCPSRSENSQAVCAVERTLEPSRSDCKEGWVEMKKIAEDGDSEAVSVREEIQSEDEKKRKNKNKKLTEKKKSRIRRLFTGMRLKQKGDSDETSSECDEDDTEVEKESSSEVTLKSREGSGGIITANDDVLQNRTTLTRIIHRVQTKANKMWENIGNRLGGKADSEEEDTTESSREPSISMSEMRQLGVIGDCRSPVDASEPNTEVMNLEASSGTGDVSTEELAGKGALRRIASGLKSGFMPNKTKK